MGVMLLKRRAQREDLHRSLNGTNWHIPYLVPINVSNNRPKPYTAKHGNCFILQLKEKRVVALAPR